MEIDGHTIVVAGPAGDDAHAMPHERSMVLVTTSLRGEEEMRERDGCCRRNER